MYFQPLNIFNFIIILFSLILFIISLFLKIFKINGFFIILGSIVVYIVSIFFRNLFLQFLGTSVLFIFYFLFIYYIVIYIFYHNKKLEFISIHDGVFHPLEKVFLKIDAKRIPINFPCIFFILKFDVYERDNLMKSFKIPVSSKSKNYLIINTIFDRHGRFNLKNFNFIFRDIFGLTKYLLKLNFESILTIYPYFSKAEKIPFFLDKGGEEVIQSIVKVNSTDFFENRKYYPGDDTRRINWKIFAHSGELHIREVEKIPPKIGQILFLYAPYSRDNREYEYLTSLFLSTVHFLLKYNFQLKIIYPGNLNGSLIDKTKEKEFNNIINYSYQPIIFDKFNQIKNAVFFASFEEYKKVVRLKLIKDSYAVVSLNNEDINENINYLNLLLNVNNYDGLVNEMVYNFKKEKNKKDIEKEIQELKGLSINNKIDFKLYRIDDEPS